MLKISYTKIKGHICTGLGEIRRNEISCMILTVEDGVATKGLTLKRKNLTTEAISEACTGDTVVFVPAIGPVFSTQICEQIRLLKNDLESVGFELLDYVLVTRTDAHYASEIGLV